MTNSASLEPVAVVPLPAVKSFAANDKFREGHEIDGVKLGYTGTNFDRRFLVNGGKQEICVPAQNLRVYTLLEDSSFERIIAKLGGEEQIETALAHIWEMLKRQGHGQEIEDGLVVNGNSNIFYVRDAEKVLWAVDCSWNRYYACWGVTAPAIASPLEWEAGDQVFSP